MVLANVQSPSGKSPSGARHGSYRVGFAFGILSFLAMAIFGVVSTIATARIYGVQIIGEFALVSAPVVALWVLSTAKEQAALIKEITQLPPRHPRVTQLFSAVFTFSSGLTITMSALGAVAATLIFRGPLHHPELVTPTLVSLAGYAFITNTGWNIDSIFSAFVAGRQLFWVRLHETLSFLTIAIVLGLVWHSIWGLVIGTIGGSLTALLHRIVAVRPYIRPHLSLAEYRIGLKALPGLLRFGLKITPGSMAQGISQQAGVWAIGAVAPLALVGAYNRAQAVPERLQQVNIRIVEVLYPTLVGRRTSGDGEGFDRALVDSIRYALVGMLLIAAIGGGAAHSILEVFGPGFTPATTALALLIAYPALASITTTQTQALYAVDRPGLTSVVALARLAVTIVVTVILTPRIGITGPAIAILAGFVLQVCWSTIALRPFLSRPLHVIWGLRERIALVVAYAAGFGAARVVEHAAPSTAGLLLSLTAGTIAYLCILIVGGAVNARDRRRLAEVFANLRSRYGGRRVARASGSEETLQAVDGAAASEPVERLHHSADSLEAEPSPLDV
jgi:O-antigen/teichoic acid export membrane protein